MLNYVIKRIAIAIPTLLILIVFSFLLMHAAPGGPFTSERTLPPQVLANIEAKYGLDQPLWRQMTNYIWGIVTELDFGPSFRYKDRTVNEIIAQGFPITLKYGSLSFVFAVAVEDLHFARAAKIHAAVAVRLLRVFPLGQLVFDDELVVGCHAVLMRLSSESAPGSGACVSLMRINVLAASILAS